ncbi:MAG TPA: acyl-CoA thioesterase [Bacteroidia bacterium]|nr:acyl-CoA thioesterase [Bacteroidia bacterium]
MKAKSPKVSETIKTEVVCPNDTNPMGLLQGGRLVQWMDIAAAICAQSHAEKICVTASIDSVNFKNSARVGDVITIRARITRAFRSSMEIFVETHSRNTLSRENHLINEAYFTFVALDDHAHVTQVAAVRPVTKEEQEQYHNAMKRKKKKSII